jgi:hypothetical protein
MQEVTPFYLLFQYIFHVGNDASLISEYHYFQTGVEYENAVQSLLETNSIVSFFNKLGSMDEIANALSLLLYLIL